MQIDHAAVPFRHWVIDLLPDELTVVPPSDAMPDASWPGWIRYENSLEQKVVCDDVTKMPGPHFAAVLSMQSPRFLGWLEALTSINHLTADPSLRGGGMHLMKRGDRLACHIDYKYHPTLHLERRLNAILFLNAKWNESWGGALELWDSEARHVVRRVFPAFRRLVIFECSDTSFHGVTFPVSCPEDVRRETLAIYYLTPPVGRKRALFVPDR